MRRFHIILTNEERDLSGADTHVGESGELVITNPDGEPIVIYAPGTWHAVEIERVDDKG